MLGCGYKYIKMYTYIMCGLNPMISTDEDLKVHVCEKDDVTMATSPPTTRKPRGE